MGSGRVPEIWDPGKYREGNIQVSTGNGGFGRVSKMWDLGEYRKRGIQASIGKGKSR